MEVDAHKGHDHTMSSLHHRSSEVLVLKQQDLIVVRLYLMGKDRYVEVRQFLLYPDHPFPLAWHLAREILAHNISSAV
jgi:hypothetical protein